MLKVRSFPLALPFGLLASLAACSSSSSVGTTETPDSGLKKSDTGVVTHSSATSSVTTSASGQSSTSGVAQSSTSGAGNSSSTATMPVDAGPTGPQPAAGSKAISLTGNNPNYLAEIIGLTTDDQLVFFDATGGVSAGDITGKVTQIAPGPTTDGGIGPVVAGLGGNVVAILTDYTTKTVSGNVEPVSGTLSIWSHTGTAGKLIQVATKATGIINIAADSSYVVYADGADTTGTKGNLGVVTGAGTGAADIIENVIIDVTSTSCAPFALFDKATVVTSTCALEDGGKDGTPQITSFASAGTPAWAPTVLATGAGTSSPYTAPYAVNFTTDTSGDNVLTVVGKDLNSQGVSSTTPTTLSSTFAAPAMGAEYFYITPSSSYALFLDSTGKLNKSTYATPTAAPTTAVLNAGPILGVQVISPDLNYEVDYNTPINMATGAPTSLTLRSTSTGMAVGSPLVTNAIASTFGGVNGFTADSKFVIFTTDLKAVGTEASTGTLYTAPVTTGVVNQIVSNTTVWNANPLTGSSLIYNQNYITAPYSTLPNGAAYADIYVQSASGTGNGTLVVTGADASDYFYLTADKSHMFYSFTQIATVDGGIAVYPADGIYVVALPAAP